MESHTSLPRISIHNVSINSHTSKRYCGFSSLLDGVASSSACARCGVSPRNRSDSEKGSLSLRCFISVNFILVYLLSLPNFDRGFSSIRLRQRAIQRNPACLWGHFTRHDGYFRGLNVSTSNTSGRSRRKSASALESSGNDAYDGQTGRNIMVSLICEISSSRIPS